MSLVDWAALILGAAFIITAVLLIPQMMYWWDTWRAEEWYPTDWRDTGMSGAQYEARRQHRERVIESMWKGIG